jgi:Flp pilus assembly protein TadG
VRPRVMRSERGAVLVETAIILPIFIVLVFGIIEYSAAYHDSSLAADAARSAGRIASAESLNPDYAIDAASAASAALQGMPSNQPQQLWIYKANSNGYPGSETSFTSCDADCIEYVWQQSTKSFNTAAPGGGGWPASDQQVCTSPSDEVGVYVQVQHNFITKLFGASVTLSDHSVFRLEPAALAEC